ncbi:MAG: hypothetical protein ACK2T6_01695 [Anaerolineae bacterium]|jgi:hypothetical protein
MAKRTGNPADASDYVVVSVEVNGRRRQVEVTTMRHGSGRHMRYTSLNQVPPDLRGEALELLRDALLNSGYSSLAEIDQALTSELVVPEEEEEAAADE